MKDLHLALIMLLTAFLLGALSGYAVDHISIDWN